MSEIITTFPININSVNPQTPGKIIPVMASDLMGYFSDGAIQSAVTWSECQTERKNDADLNVKALFQHLNMEKPLIMETRDNDENFIIWCQRQVGTALDKGTLKLSEQFVLVCSGCDQALVLKNAPVPEICANCNSDPKAKEASRKILTMHISPNLSDITALVEHMNVPKSLRGDIKGYPTHDIMISKPRTKGVALDTFGLEKLVLDPRVQNCLAPIYLAEINNRDVGWGICSAKHIGKALPYIYGFRENVMPRLGVMGISQMPLTETFGSASRCSSKHVLEVISAMSFSGRNWNGRSQELAAYARRVGMNSLGGNFNSSRDFMHAIVKQLSPVGRRMDVAGLAQLLPQIPITPLEKLENVRG